MGLDRREHLTQKTNWCKPWLAGLLGFFTGPIGLMYVGRIWVSIAVSLAFLVIGFLISTISPDNLGLIILTNIFFAILAFFLAKKAPTIRPAYSRWYGLIIGCFLLSGVIFLTRAFIIEPFKVPSESMFPTIRPNRVILAKKWGFGHYETYGITVSKQKASAKLQRGDLIVYERINQAGEKVNYVTRVIGLAGDDVHYENGQLSINGTLIPQKLIDQNDPVYADYQKTQVYQSTQLTGYVFEQSLGEKTFRFLSIPEIDPYVSKKHYYGDTQDCQVLDAGIDCKVPEGKMFLLGDNRPNSVDSRMFGLVSTDQVIAKVVRDE